MDLSLKGDVSVENIGFETEKKEYKKRREN